MRNASFANASLSDEEIKGYITDNPDLWFYQVCPKKLCHFVFKKLKVFLNERLNTYASTVYFL